MTLSEQMLEFIEEKQLFSPHSHIILAVSGGLDSMVLLDVCARSKVKVSIAHCNFQLRGDESDGDEQFVIGKAKQYNIPCYTKKFDTERYAAEQGVSVQVAARELRYHWMEQLREQEGAEVIATAHHKNDAIETMLFNLVRGTGVKGLTGIPVKNGKVVRPLLFTFRRDLEKYAEEGQLKWREDSSNETDKYSRNYIRHQLIPAMQELNPSLENTLAETIGRMEEVDRLYRQSIQRLKNELIHFEITEDCYKISLLELTGRQVSGELFYELIRDYGFHADQAEDMLKACFSHPGKRFFSQEYEAIVDRLYIFIREREERELVSYAIDEKDLEAGWIPFLEFKKLVLGKISIDQNPDHAYLDYDALKFPPYDTTVGKWR